MKKGILKITGFKIGAVLTILIVALYFSNVSFLDQIELKALDLRFVQRGAIEPDSPAVIVAIDDKSVKKLGRWPWPRSYIAGLVDFMTEARAKVVGFDITFSEPDHNSELELINDIELHRGDWKIKSAAFDEYIRMKKEDADNDQILTEAIRTHGRVILGYFFHTEETALRLDKETVDKMTRNLELIAPSKLSAIYYASEQAQKFRFVEFTAADVNIEKISKATLGFGYFNVFPDVDGTVRWSPLVVKYSGELFPPLSLQILREYLRKDGDEHENIVVRVNDLGVYELGLGGYVIPTDAHGRMMINFRGPSYTFDYYSFVDIMEGKVPKETFTDKMVIVGATSVGIYDLRVTPFSSVYPGVEVHANIIDNILNSNPLVSPDWAKGVDVLTILILGFLVSMFIPRHKASESAVIVISILAGYIVLNYYVFARTFVWLNIVYPVITVSFVSLVLYIYRFATEEREKRWIRGAFSHYVTESVVSEMLKSPEKLTLGGEKKDLTVLFSDIRGFTTISEGLTPAELVHLLNEYLTEMTRMVFKYEGTLDKYMGDAIMAIYGAPKDQPDHPLRACRTALDMMSRLKEMQKKWEEKGTPKIDIGIGINTGAMSVGNMGSEVRFDYTVMGDNVNLGSRLEGINKQYGTNIIISEFTFEHVKENMICRRLDLVRVKGKKLPVKIYQLVAGTDDPEAESHKEFCSAFELALDRYLARDFSGSLEMFKKLEEKYPGDKSIKLYIKRANDFIASPPPPEWDGVFVMTTK